MGSAATISSSEPQKVLPSTISSIKDLAESGGLASIPSTFYSLADRRDEVADDLAASIPVIDLSLLTSPHPQLRADTLRQFAKACAEWNFFMIINHGIPESLMKDVMDKSVEFHNLPLEEKKEFLDEGLFAPIRYGTSSHSQSEKTHYWRDYLRAITFPEFNFPHKPPGFKELGLEYSRQIRGILKVLLEGISESLGLGANAIADSTGFEDSGFQKFQVNLYPPCPRPDLALGLPPHTDNGFFTFLFQNGIGGLQVKHHGKWVNVNPLPNCLLAIPGDQLELVSNGRYKSCWHRAILNSKVTRATLTMSNGPPLDKEIGPVPELLRKEGALFKSIKYKDYILLQQKARCVEGRALDDLRIN